MFYDLNMKKIYFATTNENKLREAREILKVVVEGVKLQIDEVQTLNPEEAAEKKAQAAYKAYGKPVLVEDTSLFFDALNGLPGVLVDYFMDSLGNEGLLRIMKNEKNRGIKAITTLSIFDGETNRTFKGEVFGSLAKKILGKSGFGWDPIFIPKGFDKSFAQMTSEEKNKISMRRKAFLKLKKYWL